MSEQDTQAVIDVATRAAVPNKLTDELFALAVPEGASLEVVDIEELLRPYKDTPRRKNGTVQLTQAASLVQYVNEHKDASVHLYASWRHKTVVAVLNDHQEGAPGWGDHRAVLTLTTTPEWDKWREKDGVLAGQVAFAEHLEDLAPTIVDPPAADMLELAQTFQANVSVDFKSRQLLSNGETTLRFEEKIGAAAGTKGNMTIPAGFLLRLSIFDGAEPVEIGCRLRYRLRDGQLTIGYAIENRDTVLREAVEEVVAGIEAGTDLTALWGTPRS